MADVVQETLRALTKSPASALLLPAHQQGRSESQEEGPYHSKIVTTQQEQEVADTGIGFKSFAPFHTPSTHSNISPAAPI